MKIGIDLDGVLADFNGGFSRVLGQVMGKCIDPKEPKTHWEWPYVMYGATMEEHARAWLQVAESDHWWQTLETAPGVDGETFARINRLAADHDIYFVTSRVVGRRIKHQTEQWLKGKGIENPTVLVMGVDKCMSWLGWLDVMIDDDPVTFNGVNPRLAAYLIDTPYNASISRGRSVRVAGINGVLGRLLYGGNPA